ncbi:MarR family winged helix-turn-helix transcriptional regulator [Agrococcus casei]|uniref:MarR family winged helix-turn-helix transcriptional regulator n=1 Tax=Agrococcus casei TaxID=343512 RepID=UPI003F8FFB66
MDRVSDFLNQWHRERPDLDVSPMGIHGRIKRAAEILERGQRDHFAAKGLKHSEFDVLATLRRSGAPFQLTPKDLVAATMSSGATVTNRLSELESRGLLTRHTDPTNRREVIVTLTDEGRATVDEVVVGHLATEERQLDGLTASDREQLASLLQKLLAANGDTAARSDG